MRETQYFIFHIIKAIVTNTIKQSSIMEFSWNNKLAMLKTVIWYSQSIVAFAKVSLKPVVGVYFLQKLMKFGKRGFMDGHKKETELVKFGAY